MMQLVCLQSQEIKCCFEKEEGSFVWCCRICTKVEIETSLWLRRQWEDKELAKEKFHQKEEFYCEEKQGNRGGGWEL